MPYAQETSPPVAEPRLRRTANELEVALSTDAAHLLGFTLRQPHANLARALSHVFDCCRASR